MNVQRNIILPVSCYNYCTRLHSGTDRMITSWWYDVRQPLSLLRNVMMLLIITITASKYSPLPQNLKCPLCTRMMNEYPPILFPGLSQSEPIINQHMILFTLTMFIATPACDDIDMTFAFPSRDCFVCTLFACHVDMVEFQWRYCCCCCWRFSINII